MIHAQSEMKWFEAWIYRAEAYHYVIYSWMLHVCNIHVYVNGSYTHQTERMMLVLHPFMSCTRVYKSIIHSSDGNSDARSTSIHTMYIPFIHAKVACIYATGLLTKESSEVCTSKSDDRKLWRGWILRHGHQMGVEERPMRLVFGPGRPGKFSTLS